LAIESLEFGDLMRQLVPEIHVWLVRSVDGGHPLPRAKVKLDLSGVVPDAQYVPGLGDLLTREVTLDLFEAPQRERIRVQAVRLINGGLTQRQVAMQLSEPCTQPAVQDALALDQKMRQLGMESPYVILRAPPEDYHKLHRHLHPRYRFTPLAGYQQPAI
jgi:hypothetical protein